MYLYVVESPEIIPGIYCPVVEDPEIRYFLMAYDPEIEHAGTSHEQLQTGSISKIQG